MEKLYELRQKTKALLRAQTPSIDNYEKALPLCKELWEHFSETHNLWDAQQYANCLKKLGKIDDAELVCDYIYNIYKQQFLTEEQIRPLEYIKRLYTWITNDKYIKPVRGLEYKYSDTVLDKLILLNELIESLEVQDQSPSFSFCVLSVIRVIIKSGSSYDNQKLIFVLNLLDPKLLSSTANSFTDKTGKEREAISEKESFFELKSELLYKEGQYEDCILCCTEAIDEVEDFHYGNDVWFERRVAAALGQLGKNEEAIKTLKNLIITSDKWFLLYEIGKLYLKIGDTSTAIVYMLRAACTKDPDKMKIKMIETIGDILAASGENLLAQENYNLVRQIREDNDWSSSYKLNDKIKIKETVKRKDVQRHWLTLLHNKVGAKQGTIIKILSNRRGGFIQSDQIYYFQYKNFFGKNELSKVGDNVDFIVVDSFDKKRAQNTKEAVAIIPTRISARGVKRV